jgi:hypothetical protein
VHGQQHSAADREPWGDGKERSSVSGTAADQQEDSKGGSREPHPTGDHDDRRQATPADHHADGAPRDRHPREHESRPSEHDLAGYRAGFLGDSQPWRTRSTKRTRNGRKRSRRGTSRPIRSEPAESPPPVIRGSGGGHTPSKRIATSAQQHWRLVAFVRPPGSPQPQPCPRPAPGSAADRRRQRQVGVSHVP